MQIAQSGCGFRSPSGCSVRLFFYFDGRFFHHGFGFFGSLASPGGNVEPEGPYAGKNKNLCGKHQRTTLTRWKIKSRSHIPSEEKNPKVQIFYNITRNVGAGG